MDGSGEASGEGDGLGGSDGSDSGAAGEAEPAGDGCQALAARTARDRAPTVGSLAEAIEQATGEARAGQLEQLEHEVDLRALLDEVTQHGDDGAPRRGAIGTGKPGGRMPNRGVDRPPMPDEIAHAGRYATRLRQAMTLGTRSIDKRTPGGRFDGRAYARGQAQRAHGRPVSTHPWQITRQVSAPISEPHVALVIDTSGSMGAYENALGPIAWILPDGLRHIGGRCASALFGASAELLSDGRERLRLVPGIRTGGGTAFAGDALVAASDGLEMSNPRRPRFAYVLSDGGWYDTPAGVERIRALAAHGVPTVHIAIGCAPLSVEADRIVVITDPPTRSTRSPPTPSPHCARPPGDRAGTDKAPREKQGHSRGVARPRRLKRVSRARVVDPCPRVRTPCALGIRTNSPHPPGAEPTKEGPFGPRSRSPRQRRA